MISNEIILKATKLYDFAVKLGYSHSSAIGVCANVMAESSFNEGASELGGFGFGLGQWTPQANLTTQAQQLGYTQAQSLTFDVQCDILLRGSETGQWSVVAYKGYDILVISPQTLDEFKKSTDLNTATMNYMAHWERPNEDPETNHKERRKQHAKEFDEKIRGGGSGTGGSKPVFPTVVGLNITEKYGWRTHPISGEQQFHAAIDIGGGTTNHPLYATQSGTVIVSSYSSSGGNMLVVKHTGDKYFSQYLHLAEPSLFGVGATVSKGQKVGLMGTTGNSTGIHLHFAIATSENGFSTEEGTIDPLVYLEMEFGGGDGGTATGSSVDIIQFLLMDALNGWRL